MHSALPSNYHFPCLWNEADNFYCLRVLDNRFSGGREVFGQARLLTVLEKLFDDALIAQLHIEGFKEQVAQFLLNSRLILTLTQHAAFKLIVESDALLRLLASTLHFDTICKATLRH